MFGVVGLCCCGIYCVCGSGHVCGSLICLAVAATSIYLLRSAYDLGFGYFERCECSEVASIVSVCEVPVGTLWSVVF